MRVLSRVIVFGADDIDTESAFWAALLGGRVVKDDQWHSIIVDGEWVVGVQHSPDHVAPEWPIRHQQQQVHLDLHVDDLEEAGRLALAAGGRQLAASRAPADNPEGNELFATYASPAGHPVDFGLHPTG